MESNGHSHSQRNFTFNSSLLEETTNVTTIASLLSERVTMATKDSTTGFEFGVTDWVFRPIDWSWWAILQLFCAILGIVGNGLVIAVLYQRRANSRSTDTLVGGLAAADFLTSVFVIPVPKAAGVPATFLGELYCRIQEPNIPKDICIITSIYTLVAISTERYIAIVHPIYFNRILTRTRVVVALIFIWVVSTIVCFPRIFVANLDGTRGICVYRYANKESQIALSLYLFCLRLLIPTLVMLVTQTLIARHLHHQASHFQGQQSISFHDVARKRVLKMMLIVIITYVICWGPNQVAVILFFFGFLPTSFRGSAPFTLLITLSFFNSCVNPIIYTARFKEFRVAVWEIFAKRSTSKSALFEQSTSRNRDVKRQDQPTTGTTSGTVSLVDLVSSQTSPDDDNALDNGGFSSDDAVEDE